jgi:uncharacterized membrane protein YcaP (DUF421 family)
MKKQDIHFGDIHRILFGTSPPVFLLEVFFRTLILYIFLLFILRWLGKRMSGQLSIMELAVMLTLGAIVCVPMQIPDRGILQGFLLLLCAVFFQKGFSLAGVLNSKIEDITEGKVALLVKNGVMQIPQMEKERISRQQIFAQLRRIKIFNLGVVDRMYLEASGIFSIFQTPEPKPGLSIMPPDDFDIQGTQIQNVEKIKDFLWIACINCGFVKKPDEIPECKDCGHKEWTKAVM